MPPFQSFLPSQLNKMFTNIVDESKVDLDQVRNIKKQKYFHNNSSWRRQFPRLAVGRMPVESLSRILKTNMGGTTNKHKMKPNLNLFRITRLARPIHVPTLSIPLSNLHLTLLPMIWRITSTHVL